MSLKYVPAGRARLPWQGLALAALILVSSAEPADACSPPPDRGAASALADADVVLRGKFRIVGTEALSETREVATIEIAATHYLKWPVGRPPQPIFKISQFGLFDDTNCPPWYEDETIVYFAFKKGAGGDLELSEVSSFFMLKE